MSKTFQWANEQRTEAFAKVLAPLVEEGDILALNGELGAGKTAFTRYLAQALGINRRIKSPTFNIIREYQDGKLPLYHIDAYRLEEGGSEDLGLEEYFDGDGLTVIEWPQFIEGLEDWDYLEGKMTKTGETSREITFIPHGPRSEELLASFVQAMGD